MRATAAFTRLGSAQPCSAALTRAATQAARRAHRVALRHTACPSRSTSPDYAAARRARRPGRPRVRLSLPLTRGLSQDDDGFKERDAKLCFVISKLTSIDEFGSAEDERRRPHALATFLDFLEMLARVSSACIAAVGLAMLLVLVDVAVLARRSQRLAAREKRPKSE